MKTNLNQQQYTVTPDTHGASRVSKIAAPVQHNVASPYTDSQNLSKPSGRSRDWHKAAANFVRAAQQIRNSQ